MNSKILLSALTIILILGAAGTGSFLFFQKTKLATTSSSVVIPQTTVSLSVDQKSIVANNIPLLTIGDEAIFNFFKTQSQLCNKSNINNTPRRKMFCEDKTTFTSSTYFTSITSSPNGLVIGFTLATDELSPDTVVVIFYPTRTTTKINFLTNFYLGNKFISFSPNGDLFIYQDICFEGMCGLTIKNSDTLFNVADLNNPIAGPDSRTEYVEFIKWLSNNSVEYKLGTATKQISF